MFLRVCEFQDLSLVSSSCLACLCLGVVIDTTAHVVQKAVRVRDSKFGPAFVIETSPHVSCCGVVVGSVRVLAVFWECVEEEVSVY